VHRSGHAASRGYAHDSSQDRGGQRCVCVQGIAPVPCGHDYSTAHAAVLPRHLHRAAQKLRLIKKLRSDFMKAVIRIREQDHVATAITSLEPGDVAQITGVSNGETIVVREAIPAGHKIALRPIAPEEEILKYGEVIGAATAPI